MGREMRASHKKHPVLAYEKSGLFGVLANGDPKLANNYIVIWQAKNENLTTFTIKKT